MQTMCAPITYWLHEWQDLVAGLIGGMAVTSTVWWTLRSERRRRDWEAAALKVALGAELRMFARQALDSAWRVIKTLQISRGGGPGAPVTVQELVDGLRFARPVIYPNTAGSLGLLGKAAHELEFFFFQFALARDAVERLDASRAAMVVLHRGQLFEIGESLLRAAQTAAAILPTTFTPGAYSENDPEFGEAVRKAREELDLLKAGA